MSITVLRRSNRAPSIPPVILGSIRNVTPRDGMVGALVLAGLLFGAGVVFGWAFSAVDNPICMEPDR